MDVKVSNESNIVAETCAVLSTILAVAFQSEHRWAAAQPHG
jgi:hypothetical protein